MASIFFFLLLLSPTSLLLSEAGTVIYPSRTIYPGDSLRYRDYLLELQHDCNLVYTDGGKVIWATNTKASVCYCTMENDGQLVLYDGARKFLWTSGTTGRQGDYVFLIQSNNRNLVIAGPITWSSNTQRVGTPLVPTDANIGNDNVLIRLETIYPGNSLKNGIWELKMQHDCNLVLYENGNKVLWSTNTARKAEVCYARLEGDGELAIFDGRNGNRIWVTNTKAGGNNFALILQNNGNLVLSGQDIWRSHTGKVGTDFPTYTTLPLSSIMI